MISGDKQGEITDQTTTTQATNRYATRAGNPPQKVDCWNGANAANDPQPKRHHQQEHKTDNTVKPTPTSTTSKPKN